MNWQEIRETYPHRWLVVEAITARTEGDRRVITDLVVLEVFSEDWQQAWDYYKSIHHTDKTREYYVLHTDRPELNIGVIDALGVSAHR